MKSTGIVRRIDQLGRIVIPMEVRKTFGIEDGDPIEIYTDGDGIVLEKYAEKSICNLCEEHLVSGKFITVEDKPTCYACIHALQAKMQEGKE